MKIKIFKIFNLSPLNLDDFYFYLFMYEFHRDSMYYKGEDYYSKIMALKINHAINFNSGMFIIIYF